MNDTLEDEEFEFELPNKPSESIDRFRTLSLPARRHHTSIVPMSTPDRERLSAIGKLKERSQSSPAIPPEGRERAGDPAITHALKLLHKLQGDLDTNAESATISRGELDQIMRGFAHAFESTLSVLEEHAVEEEMQSLFKSHANVFDDSVRQFIVQNITPETESSKTFRSAVRRTSLVRQAVLGMQHTSDNGNSRQSSKWHPSLVKRVLAQNCGNHADFYAHISDPDVLTTVQNELDRIDAWDFDILLIAKAVPRQALSIIGEKVMEQLDCCAQLQCSKTTLREFIRGASAEYHDRPYHNAEHAADVARTLYHFIQVGGIGNFLTPRMKCVTIVAAIVHDMGHTGLSNNFHIAVEDDLAMQYLFRSPLEHMHCALTFQLMKKKRCNIIQSLSKADQYEIRSYITDLVLATDNSVHATHLAKLEGLGRRASEIDWELSEPDDQKLVLQMCLHAADVSNPAKSLRMATIWTERVMLEFYEQGDKERELLMPISAGFDRENPIPLEKIQAGFVIGIVRPLYRALCEIPGIELEHCLAQLNTNLDYWQTEIERKSAREKSEESN